MDKPAKNVLAVLTISHFTQHLYVGVAVLYPRIIEELNISYARLGLAIGLASVASGLLQMAFSIFPRYAPRRILLGLGNAMLSIGTAGLGLARNLWHFVAATLVGAAGSAAQHPIGVSIISEKFRKQIIGGALGLHYGLAYSGNIISPLLLTAVSQLQGWRSALYIIALPPTLTCLIVILYLRKELSAGKTVQKTSLREGLPLAFRRKQAMLIILAQGILVGGTGQGTLVTYTPSFLEEGLKLDPFNAGIIFSIMMVGGILGPLFIGRYSDIVGHLNTAIVCTLVASVATYLLTIFSEVNATFIFILFIIGISGFTIFSLLQAYLSSISNPVERDIILGLFFTIGFGLNSAWSIVVGFLIDFYFSFTPAYIFMSSLCLFATALLIYSRKLSKR